MNQGVIYVCSGSESHLKECYHSAHSLKKHNPDLSVTLFTDMKNVKRSLFDEIMVIDYKCHPLKQKILCMLRSPYKKTLYIDTDTEICGSLDYIFEKLMHHELIICNEADINYEKKPPELISYKRQNKFNTGVVAFRKSEWSLNFLEKWKNLTLSIQDELMYPGHGKYEDQYCFNKLIGEYHTEENIYFFEMNNKFYNVVRWMFEYMSREEREQIVIKHWHNLHYNILKWKAHSLLDFLINSFRAKCKNVL